MADGPYGGGEFGDLFSLPDPEGVGDYGLAMLERIFGGIIGVAMGRDGATVGDNWLNTLIEMFNMAGLFLLMLVALYTVLQVVFDTAKDGSVFGQRADATYTMIRAAAGGVAFIPIKGGFSLAQLALLWLMVQGSAMGNEGARRVLVDELDGKSFIAPTKFESPVDLSIRQQFASAFDAMVRGQVCVDGINQIVTAVSAGNSSPPMTVQVIAPSASTVDDDSYWSGQSTTATSAINYTSKEDATAMGGTRAACASITHTSTWEYETTGENGDILTSNFWAAVRNQASRAQMNTYHQVAIKMRAEAAVIANGLMNNSMTEEEAYRKAAEAVQTARETFISGVDEKQTGIYNDTTMNQINAGIQEKVNRDGWVTAAMWQRGISMATVEQRSRYDDFQIEVSGGAVDFSGDYILNRILRQSTDVSGSQARGDVVSEVINAMEGDLELWGRVAPRLQQEALGATENEATSMAQSGGQSELKGAVGKFMSWVLDLFAVREDAGYADPMVDVTEFGKGLMWSGAAVVGSGWVIEGGAVLMGGPITYGVASTVNEKVIQPIGWGFIAAGFVTATIIPMLPIVYYFSAVASWILLIVETMFAIPLAVLTLFVPAREGTLLGSWNKIIMNIFGIFMRPLFTVVGLWFSLVIIAVLLDFAYIVFGGMIGMVSPSNGIMNLFMMLGVIVVFVLVSLYIVLLGSQLITGIGDGAMQWIGIGMSKIGDGMNIGQRVEQGSRADQTAHMAGRGMMAGGQGVLGFAGGTARGTGAARSDGASWRSEKDGSGNIKTAGALRRGLLPGKYDGDK